MIDIKANVDAFNASIKHGKSLNYNEGKPRPSLIISDMNFAFNEALKVRENGAKKYDRMNFIQSKGTDDAENFLGDNFDSIVRHLMAYANGEELDEESKCYHMAHVVIRAMFALEYSK